MVNRPFSLACANFTIEISRKDFSQELRKDGEDVDVHGGKDRYASGFSDRG